MIKTIKTDILKAPVDAIVHQCNCQQTWGGGLALTLRQKFPEAYQADLKTRGAEAKLGQMFYVPVKDTDNPKLKYVFSYFGQIYYGTAERHTNYEAVYRGLEKVAMQCVNLGVKKLGIPYGLGSGLGGGDWVVIEAIIKSVFSKMPFDVVLCKLPFK